MDYQSQIKVLVYNAFSCITYIRNFFSEDCFTKGFPTIIKNHKTKELLDILEKGVYDAIDKQFLYNFTIFIIVSNHIVESYTFKINYCSSNANLKNFCLVLQKLSPLPLHKSMNIKLTFTDNTPLSYQPYGFKDGSDVFYKHNNKISLFKFNNMEGCLIPENIEYIKEDISLTTTNYEISMNNVARRANNKVFVEKNNQSTKNNLKTTSSIIYGDKENLCNNDMKENICLEDIKKTTCNNDMKDNDTERIENICNVGLLSPKKSPSFSTEKNSPERPHQQLVENKITKNTEKNTKKDDEVVSQSTFSAFDFTSQNTFPAEINKQCELSSKTEMIDNAVNRLTVKGDDSAKSTIRCTCLVKIDNYDLIYCDFCCLWLHTVCCGFFSNKDKRIPLGSFKCEFCIGNVNQKITERSLTRRLLAILYLEKFKSKRYLSSRMGISYDKMNNIFTKLQSEGFIKKRQNSYVVVKDEKIKKRLKEYFRVNKTSICIKDIDGNN